MASTQNQGPSTWLNVVLKSPGTQSLALRHKALVVVWLLATLLRVFPHKALRVDWLPVICLEGPQGHPVLLPHKGEWHPSWPVSTDSGKTAQKCRVDDAAARGEVETNGVPVAAAGEGAEVGGGDTGSRTTHSDSEEPMVGLSSDMGDSRKRLYLMRPPRGRGRQKLSPPRRSGRQRSARHLLPARL